MKMLKQAHGFLFLLCLAASHFLTGAQEGFISIDCGLTAASIYKNEGDDLTYMSDDGYVETGVNMPIDPSTPDIEAYNKVYKTVRSFPNSTRSCYHLPATVGSRYVIRAAFLYGNYDGLNAPPSFDLYLGVDLWETVTLANATHIIRSELVAPAGASVLYVCLVRNGGGTPFISSLKLRLPSDNMYAPVNSSIAVTTFRRIDVGATKITRYPADPFDRIWESDYDSYGTPKSTNASVGESLRPSFGTPSVVLQTAVYSPREIVVSWPGGIESAFFLTLEFADVVPPASGNQRRLTVQLNNNHWGDVNVTYLSSSVLYSKNALIASQYWVSIRSTNASDEGAVLNSFEIYKALPLRGLATNADDVSAIMAIKEFYQLKKYWVADPCLPQNFSWDGLACDDSPTPRIVTLDLSNSGLNGTISRHISKLTALKTLNLSRNNLNGQVPAFLQDLPYLIKIDLSNNNLSGPIPSSLQEKEKNGELTLSIENNLQICQQDQCSQDGKNTDKRRRIIIVISMVISSLIAMIIIVVVIFTIKRRKQDLYPRQQAAMGYKKGGSFTYSEVVAMTNNFEKVIGKGGSGTVYYGHLKDGREVAVKRVTGLVEQGTKEFQVEVNLLMQVHHKYLVPFIGYCEEDKQMLLIYEYMANGNLRQRLSDDTAGALNWRQRLQIALGAAVGLEYLHSGCNPGVIHRDVKSSNILLNENFEAKISDLGLSKSVISSEITHVTTAVAGTAGYLDPEYWFTSKVTEKSDVYGFGVVLFELITGQHAMSTYEGQRVPIVTVMVPRLLRGDINSIIDPRFQGHYEISSIWKVADTTMSCTAEKSFIRPTMTDVVAELKEAMEMEMSRERNASSMRKSSTSSSAITGPDTDIYPSAR